MKIIKNILFVALIIALATPAHINAQTYYDGIRIAWDYHKQEFCGSGVYARVKKLSDGTLALVYDTNRVLYIRKKSPTDSKWGNLIRVATDHTNTYNYTNAELIELSNGTLMYAWNARVNAEGRGNNYKIMCCFSFDKGNTWDSPRVLYEAGDVGREGCWEPVMLQLPTGELQLYFANEYNVPNDNQNITMMRSFDNGATWQTPEVVCFREGARDGMPVPVYLKNNLGIVFAIEDNGINGAFKPVIIKSTVRNNWATGAVSGSSGYRYSALNSTETLPAEIYAGAPYLIQLDGGQTVLSIQSGEGRSVVGNESRALMQVYVGDRNARNFGCKSTPFPMLDNPNTSVLWNSLCQITDTTIIAASSVSGLPSNNGVWTNIGKIMTPLKSIECPENTEKWNDHSSSLFIGAESQANANIRSMWDNENLYFHFDVNDNHITTLADAMPWDSDGIEIYLDTRQSSSLGLVSGMYKFLINTKEEAFCSYATTNLWNDWQPNINYQVITDETGYSITVAIPWSVIGGMPSNKSVTAHFKLHNNDGGSIIYHENLTGGNPDRPNTWWRCSLTEATGISTPSSPSNTIQLIPSVVNCGEPITLKTQNLILDGATATIFDTQGKMLSNVSVSEEMTVLKAPAQKGLAMLILQLKSGKKFVQKFFVK